MRSRGFGRLVRELRELREAVAAYVASAAQAVRRQGSIAGMLQVSIETNRFAAPYYGNAVTVRLPFPTASTPELIRCARQGLERIFRAGCAYNRAGVLLTDITPQEIQQTSLLTPEFYDARKIALMELMDRMNARWGRGRVRFAAEGMKQAWLVRQSRRSQRFTTRWGELPVIRAS